MRKLVVCKQKGGIYSWRVLDDNLEIAASYFPVRTYYDLCNVAAEYQISLVAQEDDAGELDRINDRILIDVQRYVSNRNRR